ncbi:hypothetical protein UA08_09361 [Talaromyces atroroseus]|uniref:Zn(2)-C6 fungal-type domain-containing protein n=1 Tax=Talaromyces atroroseus TaxID=1441469 RepID=A0A1Q5Q6K9_TALAT|nr:hypothetical protein UA08_09361 [Talaromyces atroroseus]OKL55380.1 hypothetical protein UA08_09361 [Talaromyces atroroseus]
MTLSNYGCTKLRDSCHSCATSKIKCPKEKPSCSKCTARGIKCQYYFAKRPGRRRENSAGHPSSPTSNVINNDDTIQQPNSISISSSRYNTDTETQSNRSRDGDTIEMLGLFSAINCTASPTSSLPNILNTPSNSTISISSMSDNFIGSYSADVFSVFGDSEMYPQLADFDSNVNNMDFVMKDPCFEHTVVDNDSITCTSNDIGSLLIPNETINFDTVSSNTIDLMSASSTVSSGMSSLGSGFQTPSIGLSRMSRVTTATSNNLACVCVAEGLDLLKTLSSAQCSLVTSLAGTDSVLSGDMSFYQIVLLENQQNIEAVSSMLSCSSCAEDSFLLTILSMIVLKILERYSNVAKERICGPIAGSAALDAVPRLANDMISSRKEPLSRTYNMAPHNDSVHGRPPAQLVLGELYRVQRLVNRLSPKLKGSKEGSYGQVSTMGLKFQAHSRIAAEENDKLTATTPISSNTLAQIECDLRTSLSSLARDVISKLRQN